MKREKLEAEISKWWNERYKKKPNYQFEKYSGHYITNNGFIELAEYFYNLGIQHTLKVINNCKTDEF